MIDNSSINCTSKQFPLNDLRVKFGNEVINYPERSINYQKLRSFITKNFNFHKDYELVIKYFTPYGIEIKIKNEAKLITALSSMPNTCGVFDVVLKNNSQKENHISDYFKSKKEENKDILISEKDYIIKENSSFFNLQPPISNQSSIIQTPQNEGNDTVIEEDNYIKREESKCYQSSFDELKQKYQKVVKTKATRFSRIKGRKELCNTKVEQDAFEEWLIIAKNNFKKNTKRYNDHTTLAIFFDKFSVNMRIRIQLYTHKSMKSKKTSRTFTFYKCGVDKDWDLLTAAKKLENFLTFAVENLFVIKGPIYLCDF